METVYLDPKDIHWVNAESGEEFVIRALNKDGKLALHNYSPRHPHKFKINGCTHVFFAKTLAFYESDPKRPLSKSEVELVVEEYLPHLTKIILEADGISYESQERGFRRAIEDRLYSCSSSQLLSNSSREQEYINFLYSIPTRIFDYSSIKIASSSTGKHYLSTKSSSISILEDMTLANVIKCEIADIANSLYSGIRSYSGFENQSKESLMSSLVTYLKSNGIVHRPVELEYCGAIILERDAMEILEETYDPVVAKNTLDLRFKETLKESLYVEKLFNYLFPKQ